MNGTKAGARSAHGTTACWGRSTTSRGKSSISRCDLKPSGPFAARKLLLQPVQNAWSLARDVVKHSHREGHSLPVANARAVGPPRRVALVGAHTRREQKLAPELR